MKTFVTIIFLLSVIFCFSDAYSQNNSWFATIGETGMDKSSSMVIDKNNNVITAGTFKTKLYVYNDTIALTNKHSQACYLLKFSNDGKLLWQQSIESDLDANISCITTDDDGNIYVGGYYSNTLYFDTVKYTSKNLNNDFKENAFIICMDQYGNVKWHKNIQSKNQTTVNELKVYNANLFVSIAFRGDSVLFNGQYYIGNESKPVYYTANCLFGKMDLDGNVVWIKVLKSIENSSINKFVFEKATNNIYITGGTGKEPLYYDNNKYLQPDTTGSIFVAKISPSGNIIWIKFGMLSYWSDLKGIYLDNSHNIYIGGSYNIFLKFPGLVLNAKGVPDQWDRADDIFLIKFDSNGNVQWGKSFGKENNPDYLSDMVFKGDNIFFTGYFTSTFKIDSFNLSSPNKDSYIGCMDLNGNVTKIITTKAMDVISFNISSALCFNNNGQLYLTGYFNHYSKFGKFSAYSRGNWDAFLWAIDKDSISSIDHSLKNNYSNLSIYPNPVSSSFEIKNPNETLIDRLVIYNSFGKEVLNRQYTKDNAIEINDFNSGVYFLKCELKIGSYIPIKLIKK